MVIVERSREGQEAVLKPKIRRRNWGRRILGLTPQDRSAIGENIRKARESQGKSQVDLFGKGSGQARQSRIERGDFALTLEILNEEASILGVSREQLYSVAPSEIQVAEGPVRRGPRGSVPKDHLELTDDVRAKMRDLRTKANLHQDDLLGSKRQTTYSRIERGAVRSISEKDLEQIARSLGTTSTRLFGGIEEIAKPITRAPAIIESAKEKKPKTTLKPKTEKKAEPVKEEPIKPEDKNRVRYLKSLMTSVVSRSRPGIKLPHFMDENVQIDFSPADKHGSSPHFHMGQFPVDARAAGENYYIRATEALRDWLKHN